MKREPLFSITEDDFEFDNFSGTGSGGQYRNRHQNCIRCRHKESGAIGIGQQQRSLIQNKKEAFKNCVSSQTFQIWLNRKIYEVQKGFTIEEKVEEMLTPENLKIEGVEEGRWVVLKDGRKILI